MTPAERFWAKVDLNGPGGCWMWMSTTDRGGYGRFRLGDSRVTGNSMVLAHRFAWELTNGPIPEGLVIDHLCRVKLCVNPSHLEPVTQRVNVRRGDSDMARNAVKIHCLRGHELSGANLYDWKGRGRNCRTCAQLRARRQRERRVAKLEGAMNDV